MALLAEELVEEWLNRQGFFTIRGLRVKGQREIDLLAVRPDEFDGWAGQIGGEQGWHGQLELVRFLSPEPGCP